MRAGSSLPGTRRSASRTSAPPCASTAATPSSSRRPMAMSRSSPCTTPRCCLARPRLGGLVADVGHTRPLFPSTFALDRLMGSAGGRRGRPPRSGRRAATGAWTPRPASSRGRRRPSAARSDIALTAVDLVLDGDRRRVRALPAARPSCRAPTTSAATASSTTPPSRCATPRRAGRPRGDRRCRLPPRQRHAGDLLRRPVRARREPARRPRLRVPVVHRAAPTSAASGRGRTPPQRPAARRHRPTTATWRRSRARSRPRGAESRGARASSRSASTATMATRSAPSRSRPRASRASARRLGAAGRCRRDPAGGRLRGRRDRRQRRGLPRRRRGPRAPRADQCGRAADAATHSRTSRIHRTPLCGSHVSPVSF